MSLTRSEYKELGLKLVSLEERSSHTPKRPSMVGEKKYDRIGDPFKLFIEESLTQQRNDMMDSFRKSFGNYQQVTYLLHDSLSE
jgi:hypothetical protein